jgi:predicted PhzF superfamily epimerase YddE/YHI9
MHCVLAPYWCDRLGLPEVFAHQASERGGTMHARLAGDRTLLTGDAVTVLRGSLVAPIAS